ncbi:MAG: hypothetical protein P1S59_02770 [bacterium]|nr:hypothetical protein [bacterium]
MKRLKFQHSRRDLYDIIRITASQRPFRRVAMPALAGFVFLGHAIDGNYDKGLVWAVLMGALYWSISHIMFWINVFGAGNVTLLAPQEIELQDDLMVVTSEHSTEKFLKPDTADVKVTNEHLVITTSTGKLVFLERSFEIPGDFEILKAWLMSGPSGHGDAVIR